MVRYADGEYSIGTFMPRDLALDSASSQWSAVASTATASDPFRLSRTTTLSMWIFMIHI